MIAPSAVNQMIQREWLIDTIPFQTKTPAGRCKNIA